MKILYLSNIGLPPTFPHEDYLNDMLFHGFRSIFGADCVDVAKNESMYKGYFGNERKPMYGKGFTLYGRLDDIEVDRTDIEKKIRNKFFDYVIYGQITRSRPYLQLVNDTYPRNQIIMMNGEDDNLYSFQYRDMSIFFKRELKHEDLKVNPISFCILKEHLIQSRPTKTKQIAETPTNKHVFATEQDYYEEYQRSYFGITHKKAGWDCLRHYEIIANRCIPYFRDIYQIPPRTMIHFPRALVQEGMKLINRNPIPDDEFWEIEEQIFDHAKRHLTTEAMAKYVLETVKWK